MILIDKPIPEDCDDCFCNDDYYRCGLLNEEFPLHLSGRLPDCPLREMEKADDLISRQAAIDAIGEQPYILDDDEYSLGMSNQWKHDVDVLWSVPSLQREQLTINFARELDRETAEKLKESMKNAPVLIMAINDMPSAQPEIIRCKDCKHYAGEGMYCACDIIVHYDHFYCYYAERRTNG